MTLPSTSLAWLPTGVVVTSSAEAIGALISPMVAAAANTVVVVVIFTVACAPESSRLAASRKGSVTAKEVSRLGSAGGLRTVRALAQGNSTAVGCGAVVASRAQRGANYVGFSHQMFRRESGTSSE